MTGAAGGVGGKGLWMGMGLGVVGAGWGRGSRQSTYVLDLSCKSK